MAKRKDIDPNIDKFLRFIRRAKKPRPVAKYERAVLGMYDQTNHPERSDDDGEQ